MVYQIFMIDPPWPQRKGNIRKVRPRQGRKFSYRTMEVEEIFILLDSEIFPLAIMPHCIFIWTTEKFLRSCEEQMEQRGYKRHTRLIWDKGNGVAPAFTVRFSHEYLIWYYRPTLLPIAKNARGKFATVLRFPCREHSRKPDGAYEMLEVLYPHAIKLDVFSRENRAGWNQFGDETDFF